MALNKDSHSSNHQSNGDITKYRRRIEELESKVQDLEDTKKKLLVKNKELLNESDQLKNRVREVSKSYDELKLLLNATGLPILFLDNDLRVLEYTASVSKIFDEEKLQIGKPIAQAIEPTKLKQINKQIQRIYTTPPPEGVEFYIKKSKDWFLTRVRPYSKSGNSIEGIVLTILDVTRDKLHEKKLTHLNQTFELEIQRQNQQVDKLASELLAAERNEQKRIARLLHNDLQQKLFALQMKIDLLKDNPPPASAQKIGEIINDIEQSIKVTQRLVTNLSPPKIRNNDLQEAVNWLAQHMNNYHNLQLDTSEISTFEFQERDILDLILQMVQELLFNVVKHAEVKKARISSEITAKEIQIHVIDEGCGIAPQDKNITIDEVAHFGLSYIKEQLELIGGSITINPSKCKGTHMCLTIPMDKCKKRGS